MISQLLKLFGVNNVTKLALVFLVFSLSGIIALYASDILTTFLLQFIDNNILILILRVVSIFILYQVIIIITAIPFGQFSYFISYQRRLVKKIKLLF